MENRFLLCSFAVLVLCVFTSIGREIHKPRNCREKGQCCTGQNNTCFAQGPRLDRNPNETHCYCDANCLIMGDCCIDFHETCKAQNCKVTEWAGWEECDNPCGIGSRRRIRKVQTFPENGGKHCPVLKQRQACVGEGVNEECLQQDVEFQGEELRERGQILPAKYGIFRSSKEYDPWKGILKNLYGRNFNQILTRATYYSTYLITSTREACFNNTDAPWANYLKKGIHICVECQPTAMDRNRGMRCIGHGVKNMLTEWSAVNVPHCRGEWTMEEPHLAGTCEQDQENAFIFV